MSSQYPNQSASHPRAGQSIRSRRHIPRIVAVLCLLATVILLPCAAYAQGTPAPWVKPQYFDANGDPCSACKLYTYAAGTTTPLATYTESTLTTANANPIVLDAAGRASIFLGAYSFKFVLKTSADATLWTVDNVNSVGLLSSAIGFQLASLGGDPTSPITATSYPSGVTFASSHAGSVWYSFNSANLPAGTYALEGMMLGSGGTVTAALVNLSDGSPDTAMVTIASSSATGERQISSAITFAAAGSAKVYAVKVRVSAGYGLVWGLRLVRLS